MSKFWTKAEKIWEKWRFELPSVKIKCKIGEPLILGLVLKPKNAPVVNDDGDDNDVVRVC